MIGDTNVWKKLGEILRLKYTWYPYSVLLWVSSPLTPPAQSNTTFEPIQISNDGVQLKKFSKWSPGLCIGTALRWSSGTGPVMESSRGRSLLQRRGGCRNKDHISFWISCQLLLSFNCPNPYVLDILAAVLDTSCVLSKVKFHQVYSVNWPV